MSIGIFLSVKLEQNIEKILRHLSIAKNIKKETLACKFIQTR